MSPFQSSGDVLQVQLRSLSSLWASASPGFDDLKAIALHGRLEATHVDLIAAVQLLQDEGATLVRLLDEIEDELVRW